MRIVSGKYKGLSLTKIKGDFIRPTTDKIRGAIFSIIYSYLNNPEVFIDCFAGSGAMSIEALSCGFKTAYLFDPNPKSYKIIKENLKKSNLLSEVHLFKSTALNGIKRLEKEEVVADVIFMDPPYKKLSLIKPLLKLLSQTNVLSQDGLLVIEHDKRDIIERPIENFEFLKEKTYSNTTISLFIKKEI